MLRKLMVIIGVVLIFAGTAVGITILGKLKPKIEKSEPVLSAPTVFVTTVEPQTVNLSVITQGEVKPQTEISLSAQVSGKIVSVSENFNDGGVIKKGEILVEIEDADYLVAMAQAKARLAQAEQALRIAEVEADLAQQDAQDIGALADGTLSPLALRQPQLEQARAAYAAAKADVANAESNLARTHVRAPFNGRIRRKLADIGQIVGPGTQLAQIFSTDVALVRLPLSDEDFARLSLPLAYTADTSPLPPPDVRLTSVLGGRSLQWQGKVVRTDAAIDPTTRQIAAIVEVDDPYGKGADDGFPLAIGLFVTAEILGRHIEDVFVLPRIAVQSDSSIYLVDDDNILRKIPVKVTATVAKGMVITDGIHAGDRIVISRLGAAKVGEEVTPLAPGQPLTLTKKSQPEAKPEEKPVGSSADKTSNEGGAQR